tara:strand:+ start:44 stop:556 length:513 start_codon:yes stop_codon:yes gene_type:complete
METPYKMKGSPMQRNFGIGVSPMKNDKTATGGDPKLEKLKAKRVANTKAGKIIKFGEGSNIIADKGPIDPFSSKAKKGANFNKTGGKTTTPDFSTTKLGKAKKRLDKAKKIFKKTAKFASSKVILPLTVVDAAYTAGMGNPKSAKATDKALKKEGENKLKGINKTHVPKY